MIHPGLALQEALFGHLVAQNALLALLGEPAVYDDVPRRTKPPYVSFGEATFYDWSTGTEAGTEHQLVLNAWSDHQGRSQVLQIAQVIEQAVSAAKLGLQDHVLVGLSHEITEVTKDIKTDLFLARIRLRAVTEPDIRSSEE